MFTRLLLGAACLVAAFALPARAETELHVFVPASTRPDVVRHALDDYEHAHPGIKVTIEQGGATSELQGQYLGTVLSAKDSTLDVMYIDVIRPAQFAAAGWTVPLNDSVGDLKSFLSAYLPAYAEADTIGGKLVALPGYADAMVLYYRRDLLDKYHLAPPRTWDELTRTATTIMQGEHDPALSGISFQGKAIEGAVCTFLLPYWSQGKALVTDGHLSFDHDAAVKSFNVWLDLIKSGVARKNAAEVATDDTRQEFQAGRAVFAVMWPYGWNLFQGPTSPVRGHVGVAPIPAVAGGTSVSCLGGFQWGVSAYSTHKLEAIELVRALSSPDVSRMLAVQGSFLPAFPALYTDPAVVKAAPFMADMPAIVQGARARPVTPRYNEVSDIVRSTTNAVLAGQTDAATGASEMEAKLRRVLR